MASWRWSVRPAAPASSTCWTACWTKGLSSTRGFVCPWSASTSSRSRRALSSRQSTPISDIPKQSARPGRHHVQHRRATLPHEPRNETKMTTMTTMAAEATDPLAHRRWFTSRSSHDVIPQPDPDARAKDANRSASPVTARSRLRGQFFSVRCSETFQPSLRSSAPCWCAVTWARCREP